jgi:hypothetical protein
MINDFEEMEREKKDPALKRKKEALRRKMTQTLSEKRREAELEEDVYEARKRGRKSRSKSKEEDSDSEGVAWKERFIRAMDETEERRPKTEEIRKDRIMTDDEERVALLRECIKKHWAGIKAELKAEIKEEIKAEIEEELRSELGETLDAAVKHIWEAMEAQMEAWMERMPEKFGERVAEALEEQTRQVLGAIKDIHSGAMLQEAGGEGSGDGGGEADS